MLPQAWVLELSSFQLDGVQGFEPSAAAVLNITQDHLDWHGSMVAYAAAKSRIYGQHATMVINRDEPLVEAMIPAPEVIKSGVRGRPARVVHRKVVRFGLDAPRAHGDFGLVVESGMAWLVRAMEADPTIKRGRDGKAKDAEDDAIVLQRLMPADALRIRGRHNASNALAALALATAIGCPLAPMLHGLREYRGEPHRVEHVMTLRGVDAIDDSKGTNVGATVAALLGLGADLAPGKLCLILGGDGKGQDFAPLREPVGRFARAVALIGRDAEARVVDEDAREQEDRGPRAARGGAAPHEPADRVSRRGERAEEEQELLVRGDFEALREHVGYKLSELLKSARAGRRAGEELLFGDDWESDPLIYSLYADVLDGRLGWPALEALLERAGVNQHRYLQSIREALEAPIASAERQRLERPERQ